MVRFSRASPGPRRPLRPETRRDLPQLQLSFRNTEVGRGGAERGARIDLRDAWWDTVIARLKNPPHWPLKTILDGQKCPPIAQNEVAEEVFNSSGYIDL